MSIPSPRHGQTSPSAARDRRGWVEDNADRFVPRAARQFREQILYLVVGAWNTVFGYGAFVVLYAILGGQLGYAAIIVGSYVIAILNAYLGYRYITFRSHASVLHEFPRFSLVYLATLVANLVFFPIALHVLPLNAYAIQAMFTVGVVIASYFGHKYFSFRRPPAVDPSLVVAAPGESGADRDAITDDPPPGGK